MIYLMKDNKKVMEYGLMECTIYNKDLLPEELKDIKIYKKQLGNMFVEKTIDFNDLFKYLLSFVDTKDSHISEMDNIVEQLIVSKTKNINGYWFNNDSTLFYLSLE